MPKAVEREVWTRHKPGIYPFPMYRSAEKQFKHPAEARAYYKNRKQREKHVHTLFRLYGVRAINELDAALHSFRRTRK